MSIYDTASHPDRYEFNRESLATKIRFALQSASTQTLFDMKNLLEGHEPEDMTWFIQKSDDPFGVKSTIFSIIVDELLPSASAERIRNAYDHIQDIEHTDTAIKRKKLLGEILFDKFSYSYISNVLVFAIDPTGVLNKEIVPQTRQAIEIIITFCQKQGINKEKELVEILVAENPSVITAYGDALVNQGLLDWSDQ